MRLWRTELEPDFAINEGSYTYPGVTQSRESFEGCEEQARVEGLSRAVPESDPFRPSGDEQERVSKSGTPTQRYHYRLKAIELAWLAADFMPDDDPRTATILVTGGGWARSWDESAAELFYKTLVFRCPNTDLGRKAAALHWIPKIQ